MLYVSPYTRAREHVFIFTIQRENASSFIEELSFWRKAYAKPGMNLRVFTIGLLSAHTVIGGLFKEHNLWSTRPRVRSSFIAMPD